MKSKLLTADRVAEFTTAWQAAVKRQRADVTKARADLARVIKDADRKIAGIMKAIEDGMYSSSMKERLAALEAEKAAALIAMERADEARPHVALHPNLPEA